jgi:integrase
MDRGHRGITFRGNSAQIAFTYQGVRCRETIPIPPTKAAQKQLILKRQTILFEISMGIFDYGEHFPDSKKAKEFRKTRPDRYTIVEGLKDWLKRAQSRCQPSTLRDYASAIHHHLIPTFGDLTIDELSTLKVKEWLTDLPCSNKRKNNILIPLRQLYDEMYHDEIIAKNPLDHVKNLPIDDPLNEWLSEPCSNKRKNHSDSTASCMKYHDEIITRLIMYLPSI